MTIVGKESIKKILGECSIYRRTVLDIASTGKTDQPVFFTAFGKASPGAGRTSHSTALKYYTTREKGLFVCIYIIGLNIQLCWVYPWLLKDMM